MASLDESQPVASWCDMLEKALSNGVGGMLGYIIVILNSIAAGHENVEPHEQIGMLAGYGLAQSMANVFHVGPAVGLTGAFDTFISQANGAGDTHQCTIILGRGRGLLTLHWLLIAPIAWFSEEILQSIGIDSLSAHYAGSFNRINILGWWFRSQMYASRKFLSNLNKPRANLVISVVVVALQLIVLVIHKFQITLESLAWLTVVTIFIHAMLLYAYLVFSAPSLGMQRRWFLKHIFVLKGWLAFMKLGTPSLIQFCAEVWALEIFTVIAGYLSAPELAACTVNYNIATLGYLIAGGVSSATSGLVGSAVGKGFAYAARRTALRFVFLTFLLWLPMAGVLFFGAGPLSALFSPQEEVQSRLAPLLQLYAFALLLDCLNQVVSGTLRALGRVRFAAFAYFFFYYLVMLPLAYLLDFPAHLQVFGMYAAYTAANALMFIALAVLLYFTPFQVAVKECEDRLRGLEPEHRSLVPTIS